TLEVAYLLEGLPTDRPIHFATELNLAGLPAGADDRYFATAEGDGLAGLDAPQDLVDRDALHLVDGWLGIDVGLSADRPTSFWAYPISTVSQSEGGFELVNQSVAVVPHWILQGDTDGRWSVTLRVSVDTSVAEERAGEASAEVASV
ncbi:MAG: alpha-amylase/4-alpha-glucanotransferase domain-containing protein, partial [Planctomycetota bacterium]